MSLIEKAAERLQSLLNEQRAAQPASTSQTTDKTVSAASSPAATSSTVAPVTPAVLTPTVSAPISPQVNIDLQKLAAAGLVMPDNPGSTVAEEFRIIKRPLLANARAGSTIRNPNLIMVTSALPGEGKSFTSLNLAMSLAMELERTVLLVDADVARPSLPKMLGLPQQRGLLDVLENKSMQLSDVLLRTNVEKLNILMAGTSYPNATELLASQAMADLLDEMAQRYADRLIVFDSPPLLMTTESRVLATHMGQIVFVVQAEQSLQSAVKTALATIESCPVKLLVLNQARNLDPVTYGYGYGYGYGR
jgi:protein-tyrosine kinase